MLKWKPLEISVKNFNAQMILEEAVYNPIKCTNDNLQRHMQGPRRKRIHRSDSQGAKFNHLSY